LEENKEPLLWRKPAKIDKGIISPGPGRFIIREVDEVGKITDCPFKAHLPEFIFQKKARTYKPVHKVVDVKEAVVKIHLDRVEQAFGTGAPVAFFQKAMVKPPVSAPLADLSFGKKRIDGADHLVIMESHDDRKMVILDCPKNRRGNLMMDVVEMDEVWTFFFQEILEFPARFEGIQDSERGLYFLSYRCRAVKTDRRDKIPGKRRSEVLGMAHRKKEDPVTLPPKELSGVE